MQSAVQVQVNTFEFEYRHVTGRVQLASVLACRRCSGAASRYAHWTASLDCVTLLCMPPRLSDSSSQILHLHCQIPEQMVQALLTWMGRQMLVMARSRLKLCPR